MNKTILIAGIVLGVLAIILGAFGAHGLEHSMDTASMKSYETGVQYQMYHALFLLILGGMNNLSSKAKKGILFFIVCGTLLFSFTIYLLATNDLTAINFKSIGFLTPIGGILLICGWILMAYRVFRQMG